MANMEVSEQSLCKKLFVLLENSEQCSRKNRSNNQFSDKHPGLRKQFETAEFDLKLLVF